MQCNIDARGKAVRLTWGTLTLIGGLAAAGLTLADLVPGAWGWPVAGVLGAFGLLGIYEARAGWCVVRAMGFKTPV
jgi:hypothetical protein